MQSKEFSILHELIATLILKTNLSSFKTCGGNYLFNKSAEVYFMRILLIISEYFRKLSNFIEIVQN